jgi:hypothetical protein
MIATGQTRDRPKTGLGLPWDGWQNPVAICFTPAQR